MHTPESPEEDNVAVITRLTAHFICGSVSDLLVVISKDWNQHSFVHDSECPLGSTSQMCAS